MNFEDWKRICAIYAETVGVGGPALWAEDDPYDLADVAEESYENGDTPKDFIREVFADDLASMAHDELMEREQFEHDEPDVDIEETEGDLDE